MTIFEFGTLLILIFAVTLNLSNAITSEPQCSENPNSELACRIPAYLDEQFGVELISVFTDGRVQNSNASKTVKNPPPKELLVAVPKCIDCKRSFSVVMFNHGFNLKNSFYTQIISFISSHGFIVVAPQMYSFTITSDATQEMKDMVSIIEWLAKGLVDTFFTEMLPQLGSVALVGHSRGGKVVYGLAKGLVPSKLTYSAVAGIDPVDGTSKTSQTNPAVLSFVDSSFNFSFPSLLVGAGLGAVGAIPLFPSCAAADVGHVEFFRETKEISYHFTALDFGHMDFLDDLTGITGAVTYASCKNGYARKPIRDYTAQVLTAFLISSIYGENSKLEEMLLNPSKAPIKVETEWKDSNIS